MKGIEFEDFIRSQELSKSWQFAGDDNLMENTVTLQVKLNDGCIKVLSIHECGVLLYQSYTQNLKLFSWEFGQTPSALKGQLEFWIDQDTDNLFYQVVSILVWLRDYRWEIEIFS